MGYISVNIYIWGYADDKGPLLDLIEYLNLYPFETSSSECSILMGIILR